MRPKGVRKRLAPQLCYVGRSTVSTWKRVGNMFQKRHFNAGKADTLFLCIPHLRLLWAVILIAHIYCLFSWLGQLWHALSIAIYEFWGSSQEREAGSQTRPIGWQIVIKSSNFGLWSLNCLFHVFGPTKFIPKKQKSYWRTFNICG